MNVPNCLKSNVVKNVYANLSPVFNACATVFPSVFAKSITEKKPFKVLASFEAMSEAVFCMLFHCIFFNALFNLFATSFPMPSQSPDFISFLIWSTIGTSIAFALNIGADVEPDPLLPLSEPESVSCITFNSSYDANCCCFAFAFFLLAFVFLSVACVFL